MQFRSLAFTLVLPLVTGGVLACGDAGDVLEQASAAQALIEGGDTIEDAPAGTKDTDDVSEVGDDAVALDEAGGEGECSLARLRERVGARYDENEDGVLDESERAAIRSDVEANPERAGSLQEHRRLRRAVGKRVRFVYDADRSQSLEAAEREALRSDLQARCRARQARLLAAHDVDGDGALSDAERSLAATERRARIAERRAELLARFDVDGSAHLQPSERDALADDVRARVQAKRAALKARFDIDGDGHLDEEEASALRAHLRARVRLEEAGDSETEI